MPRSAVARPASTKQVNYAQGLYRALSPAGYARTGLSSTLGASPTRDDFASLSSADISRTIKRLLAAKSSPAPAAEDAPSVDDLVRDTQHLQAEAFRRLGTRYWELAPHPNALQMRAMPPDELASYSGALRSALSPTSTGAAHAPSDRSVNRAMRLISKAAVHQVLPDEVRPLASPVALKAQTQPEVSALISRLEALLR